MRFKKKKADTDKIMSIKTDGYSSCFQKTYMFEYILFSGEGKRFI